MPDSLVRYVYFYIKYMVKNDGPLDSYDEVQPYTCPVPNWVYNNPICNHGRLNQTTLSTITSTVFVEIDNRDSDPKYWLNINICAACDLWGGIPEDRDSLSGSWRELRAGTNCSQRIR